MHEEVLAPFYHGWSLLNLPLAPFESGVPRALTAAHNLGQLRGAASTEGWDSMKTKLLDLVACMALLGATAAASASPYVVTLEEVGSNVVATGSGSIDLTGLMISTTVEYKS